MDKKYKYMCGIIFLLANAAAIAAGIFFFWSGQERVQGFIDTVSENENMKIVKKIECEGQLEIAMPQLQKAIEEGIEFDSVFCLNDLASVGAAAALDEKNMLDEVDLYGVDASPDSKALEYPCDGLIAVNNAAAGNSVLKAAYKSASGKKTFVWSLDEFKEKSQKVLAGNAGYNVELALLKEEAIGNWMKFRGQFGFN